MAKQATGNPTQKQMKQDLIEKIAGKISHAGYTQQDFTPAIGEKVLEHCALKTKCINVMHSNIIEVISLLPAE